MSTELESAAEHRLLDDLLDQHPVANALEVDPEGRRVLAHVHARIPRVCRMPADPSRSDAAHPGERFDLITALGLLTAPQGQRDLMLAWVRQRLHERGRLVVSARLREANEPPDTSHWIPRARDARLGPDEAEDLLTDAGFVVEHVEHTGPGRPWNPGQGGSFLVVATLA